MANVVTNKCKYLLGTGLDLSSADIRVLLLKSTGTVTADTNFVSEITTHEADATNYVRKALASETMAEDDANDWALFDCEDITWTSLGGAVNNTIGWVVFYLYNVSDAAAEVLVAIDIADSLTNGNDWTAQTPNGVLRLS